MDITEKKIQLLRNKKFITSVLKTIEEDLHAQLLGGAEIKGLKLVAGRSVRQWVDDAAATLEKELGDDAYNKKLIGITDATKLVGKAMVDELTRKPEGKPVLALSDDKRKAISVNIDEHFD